MKAHATDTATKQVQQSGISELIGAIPDGVWVALVGAILAALGWFAKKAFDAWNKSRLPFKQDRDRYQAVLKAIDPSDLYYFRDPDFSCVFKRRLDGVDEAAHKLTEIHLPAYLNKSLEKSETALVEKMGTFANHLSRKFFPCRGNQNVFTMYWDTFDEWNDEDQRKAAEIQSEIGEKLKEAIEAYEAFRDRGNRLFADRLVKEKSDG